MKGNIDFEVKAKFVLSDDEEQVKRINNGLARKKEKYGEEYCPCVPPSMHSPATICNCEEYLRTGKCHCGKYKE